MPFPKISTTDRLLMHELQKNARQTNKELARVAGIAESTCLERVRALRQSGVIRGWHADVDPAALGRHLRALIHVRLQPKTTESVQAFQVAVLAAPETLSVDTVTGADDFIVEVGVSDVDALRAFVLEVITTRDDVADARTSIVYEHVRKQVLEDLTADS
jgi:DNA-binding Lrp family transcriptional regulator